MLKTSGWAFVGALFACGLGATTPAIAGNLGCKKDFACVGSGLSATLEFAARKRPRVTIYPRRVYPGHYAKRQCYSWLVTEYRPSGPVITPQMRCWWE
jgi:hypothetical protein